MKMKTKGRGPLTTLKPEYEYQPKCNLCLNMNREQNRYENAGRPVIVCTAHIPIGTGQNLCMYHLTPDTNASGPRVHAVSVCAWSCLSHIVGGMGTEEEISSIHDQDDDDNKDDDDDVDDDFDRFDYHIEGFRPE